jgi:phage-related protein
VAKHEKPEHVRTPVSRAEVHWEGDTRTVLKQWPKDIRVDFGNALNEMQEGRPATLDVRPMPSIASGVFELKTDDEAKWYRMVYLARIEDVIYVLDCFEKNTRKTEKKDLARSLDRYKKVQQRLAEERTNAKRTQRTKQTKSY